MSDGNYDAGFTGCYLCGEEVAGQHREGCRWAKKEEAAPIGEPPPAAVSQLPPWIMDFPPGTTFNVNGWDCAVRHVGQEEGHWLMLIEPTCKTKRDMSRSEYRRLKHQLGKKNVPSS